MSMSVIYRNAAAYEIVMLALYGRHYAARYRAVADLVPAGAHVLELCCGPGHLYQRYLRKKGVRYHGIDVNEKFVARVRGMGGTGEVADVRTAREFPQAEYVIMQASLYHFLPNAKGVVDAMLRSATKQVIVAEPVRNLSSSNIPLLSRLARRHTDPGSGQHERRFTEATLDELFESYGRQVLRSFLIPGGREKVYVVEPTSVTQS